MDGITQVKIRSATPEDQPEIQAILEACPEAANWADTYPMLVADSDNTVTAFLLYRPISGECEILNLAVHPKRRRLGQAKALLAHLFDTHPNTIFHLEVRASNQAAIGLYQYLDFKQSGQRPNYYANKETALLFSRTRRGGD